MLTYDDVTRILEMAEGVGLAVLTTPGPIERKANALRSRVNALGAELIALVPESDLPCLNGTHLALGLDESLASRWDDR